MLLGKWFAKHGYDSKMGARPMARLIEKEIRKPLADELLFGQLSEGGIVKVGVNKDKISLDYLFLMRILVSNDDGYQAEGIKQLTLVSQ